MASTMSRADTDPYSWPVSPACRMTTKVCAGDLAGHRLRLVALLKVAGFEVRPLRFEALLVGLVGAERLAARQKVVAGIAVA